MKKLTATLLSVVLMFSLLFVDGAFALNVFGASPYYGMFHDEQSDGGFEYNGWSDQSVPAKSSWEKDTANYHRGSKSAKFTFQSGGGYKDLYIHMDIPATTFAEIDPAEDYCWTAYVKTSSNFMGSISLEMVEEGEYTSSGLKNNANQEDVQVYAHDAGKPSTFTRFDSSNAKYNAFDVANFLVGKQTASVVLHVRASRGDIWVDDIDFKAVSMLNEDEEVEREDNTGSEGNDYVGLFDDATSDGGFEKKSWQRIDESDVKFVYDFYVFNSGRRSAGFYFDGSEQKTASIYTTFADYSEIVETQAHVWLANIKTTADFDGTVGLKLAAPSDYNASGILTAASTDTAIIYDSAKDNASAKWTKYVAADDYYTGAALTELFNNNADVTTNGKVALVLTVTAKTGKVWVDDVDFKQRSYALGDDDSVTAGAYTGLFDSQDKNNGGFEYGIWDSVASVTNATGNTKAVIETNLPHNGNRSLLFNFANGVPETLAFKSHFTDISELDLTTDSYWKAFVKVASAFDGKVTLKITAHNDLNTILLAADNSGEITIYDSTLNGSPAAYSGLTVVKNRYTAAALKTFVESAAVQANGFDVVLTVSGTTGMVFIDDIDLLDYGVISGQLNLEDPDTAYDVADNDYVGMFDAQSSNGGFEYGVWSLVQDYTNAEPSTNYSTDVEYKKSGKRSLNINFSGATKETITLKMTSYELAQLLADKDYSIASYVRTCVDFDGTVEFRITRTGDYNTALGNKNVTALSGNIYSYFTLVDTSAAKYNSTQVAAFKTAIGADTSFDVYMTVKASKGSVWVDDVNLVTDDELAALKNQTPSGTPVYNGAFVNGGFEEGAWNVTNSAATHGVTLVDSVTYGESLQALELSSTAAGNLVLTGSSIAGKLAELDKTVPKVLAFRAKGDFKGTFSIKVSGGVDAETTLYFFNNTTFYSNKWGQVMTSAFEINGSDMQLTLTLNGTGSILLDDLQILDDPDYGKMLANGGFEKGIWGQEGNGKQTIDYAVTNGSPAALKMVTDGAGKTLKAISTVYNIDETKDYKFTIDYKTVGANFGAAKVRILYADKVGAGAQTKWASWRGSEEVITTGGTTDWQTFAAVLTADNIPEWCKVANIYIWFEGVGTLYADNAVFSDQVTEEDFLLKQPDVEGAVYDGIIHNGGFEGGAWSRTANITDQTVTIDNEQTHNNSLASFKVEMPTKKNNFSQAINFTSTTVSGAVKNLNTEWQLNEAGQMQSVKNYRIGMYVKMSDDFSAAVWAKVLQNGKPKWYAWMTELYIIGTGSGGATTDSTGYPDWTYVYSPIFTVTDDDDVTIQIGVSGTGTIWFDDIDLIEDPEADWLISNGGFESGAWAGWGSDAAGAEYEKISAVKDVTCGSAQACKLEIFDYSIAGGVYIVNGISIDKMDLTKTYTLEFDLKYKGVESESGVRSAILQWYNVENADGSFTERANWYRYYGSEQLFNMGGGDMEWTHFKLNLGPSGWFDNLNSANLFFYLYDEGELWVDNVTLKERVIDGNIVAGEVTADTPDGEVQAGSTVTLVTGDSMSDIWYTVDGSDPATSETAYLYDPEGIIITHDVTIKACTKSAESGIGKVAEFKYTCAQGSLVKDDEMWPLSNASFAASLDTTEKKTGSNSIKLKGGSGRYVSTGEIGITSTYDYKLSFWAKTANCVIDNSVFFRVFLSSTAGGGDEGHPLISGVRGATLGNYGKSFFDFKADQDWTYYEVDICDMGGANTAVTLILYNNSSTGTVWLDDVKLTACPKEYYPLTVSSDGARQGNIYHESIFSNFTIEQGFVLKNDANNLETGVLHYEVVNDLFPNDPLQTGDIEIAVQGKGKAAEKIICGSVAQYGTFTINFTMTNADGNSYYVGKVMLSRVRDNTEYVQNGTSFFGVTSDINTQEWADVCNRVGDGIHRFDYDWEKVEKSKGQYSVDPAQDNAINVQVANGMEPLVIFNTHSWPSFMEKKAFPAPGVNDSASDLESLLGYIEFMVTEYKGRVKYFEFWNECDYRHWVDPATHPDAAGYTATLKKVYEVVKRANPDAVLIGGVTASTGASGVNLGWAKGVFQAGGADAMDAYSIHPYVQLFDSPEKGEWVEDIVELSDWIESEIGRPFPLWITEMGYATARTEVQGKTPERQMALSLRQYTMIKQLPNFEKMVTYMLSSGNGIYSTENQYGKFVNGFAQPMTIARAAFNYMHDGFEFDSIVEGLAPGLYAYKFAGATQDMYVLWLDGRECYADITTSNDSAAVYDIFSNNVAADYNGNTFEAEVGEKIIYIRLDKGETIDSVVLRDKVPTEGDDKKEEDKNDNTESDEDEYEYFEIIEEEEYEDDEDEDETESDKESGKVKRVKKVIKKVIKGGNGGFPWLYVIIGAAALLILAAGTVILIILIKRKKKNQANS